MSLKAIIRGDTKNLRITFSDKDKSPVDISGSIIFFTMKKNYNQSDGEAALHIKNTVHSDPTNGITSFILSAADTSALDTGVYYFDIQIVFPDGNVRTLLIGQTNVLPDVTRSVS